MPNINEKITKVHFKEAGIKYGPSPDLIEQTVNSFRLAIELQHECPSLIFFGGTPTQLFLPEDHRRASIDVDMICNKNIDEIKKILGEFFERHGIPEPRYGTLYGAPGMRFLVRTTDSNVKPAKIDIVTAEKSSFVTESISGGRVFGFDIDPITTLSKNSLFAKKLIVLDTKGYGLTIRASDVVGTFALLAKQIYDLSELKLLLDTDWSILVEQIKLDVKDQANFNPKVHVDVVECLNGVIDLTKDIWKIEMPQNRQEKDTKSWIEATKTINTYLPKAAKNPLTNKYPWASKTIILCHLIFGIRNYLSTGEKMLIDKHFENGSNQEFLIGESERSMLFSKYAKYVLPKSIRKWDSFSFWCFEDLIDKGIIKLE